MERKPIWLSKEEQLHLAFKDADVEKVREVLKSTKHCKDLFREYDKHHLKPIVRDAVELFESKDIVDSKLGAKLAILDELVGAGADVNGKMLAHYNSLQWAMQKTDSLPIVNHLVKLGADVNAVMGGVGIDIFWGTMLKQAVLAKPEYVELLLANNARPTADDDNLAISSALWFAAFRTCNGHQGFLNPFIDWYEANERPFPWEKVFRLCFAGPVYGDRNDTAMLLMERTTLNTADVFKLAADGGCTKFMCTMLRYMPWLLQSDWLVSNYLPAALKQEKHKDFLKWMQLTRSQPLSLKLMVKFSMIPDLVSASSQVPSVGPLPLPELLKDYLKEPLLPFDSYCGNLRRVQDNQTN